MNRIQVRLKKQADLDRGQLVTSLNALSALLTQATATIPNIKGLLTSVDNQNAPGEAQLAQELTSELDTINTKVNDILTGLNTRITSMKNDKV